MNKIWKSSAAIFVCMMMLASVSAAAEEAEVSAEASQTTLMAEEIINEGDENDYSDRFISSESRTEMINAAYCGIRVYIDGQELIPNDVNGRSTEPFILSGTTYLPARAVSEALGLKVEWDEKTKTVILASGGQKNLGAGERASTIATKTENVTYSGVKLKINGIEILPCDVKGNVVEPFILRGTTYLPLRAVSGALGLSVEWDAENKTIRLTSGMAVQRILAEEVVKNDGELMQLLLNTYSSDGKAAMTRNYDWTEGLAYEFTEYEYDKDGKLLQEVTLNENGDKKETRYTWDAAGKLSNEHTTEYEGQISEITYTWNANGLLATTKEVFDGEVVYSEYAYDGNGNQKSFTQKGSDSWEQLVSEYNDEGLLLKQIRTGNDYSKPEVTVYKYENGVMVSDEETGPNGTLRNKWNGAEMLISSEVWQKDSDGMEYSSSEQNTYDESGRLSKTVVEIKDGDDSDISSINYSYAADGTLVNTTCITEHISGGIHSSQRLITNYCYQVIPE